MQKDTVQTQEMEGKVKVLEWQLEQHKAVERKMADVFYFLRAALGGSGFVETIELDNMARSGLDFLMNCAANTLYSFEGGAYSELEGDLFGRGIKYPKEEQANA